MPIVHLEFGLPEESFRQEHADFPLQIGELRFSISEASRADWLVVASYVARSTETSVPRGRRIFIVTEPNGYFPTEHINQYGILVSPFAVPGFRGIFHQSHGALVDSFSNSASFHGLISLPIPEKRDAISVVVSRKSVLSGHRQRLKFIRALRTALGDRLEVYGHGIQPIAEKADVILPNKYHLVLENTVMPSYWTEKLADAYLGYAFPFVSGPPDLERWFSADSFLPIDIGRPNQAIDSILRSMNDDLFTRRLGAVIEARNRLMREERICPVIARVIAAHPNAEPRLDLAQTITPAPRPPLLQRIRREVARFYWQVDEIARRNVGGAT